MLHIDELRQKIETIDSQIIQLIVERQKISLAIGAFKKEENLPVFNAQRERDLMEKYQTLACENSIDADFIKKIFALIHDNSKELQR